MMNSSDFPTLKSRIQIAGGNGYKEKRPQLDKLMADAHRRKFDTVVVWKFDRFARSVSHLLRALVDPSGLIPT
jgi:DNA invertase Pin-like site-specific DNA recombinase